MNVFLAFMTIVNDYIYITKKNSDNDKDVIALF